MQCLFCARPIKNFVALTNTCKVDDCGHHGHAACLKDHMKNDHPGVKVCPKHMAGYECVGGCKL